MENQNWQNVSSKLKELAGTISDDFFEDNMDLEIKQHFISELELISKRLSKVLIDKTCSEFELLQNELKQTEIRSEYSIDRLTALSKSVSIPLELEIGKAKNNITNVKSLLDDWATLQKQLEIEIGESTEELKQIQEKKDSLQTQKEELAKNIEKQKQYFQQVENFISDDCRKEEIILKELSTISNRLNEILQQDISKLCDKNSDLKSELNQILIEVEKNVEKRQELQAKIIASIDAEKQVVLEKLKEIGDYSDEQIPNAKNENAVNINILNAINSNSKIIGTEIPLNEYLYEALQIEKSIESIELTLNQYKNKLSDIQKQHEEKYPKSK